MNRQAPHGLYFNQITCRVESIHLMEPEVLDCYQELFKRLSNPVPFESGEGRYLMYEDDPIICIERSEPEELVSVDPAPVVDVVEKPTLLRRILNFFRL